MKQFKGKRLPTLKAQKTHKFVMKGENLMGFCKNSTNYTLVTSAVTKQNTNSTCQLTEILILAKLLQTLM
jgi:hypothetical protein